MFKGIGVLYAKYTSKQNISKEKNKQKAKTSITNTDTLYKISK